MSKEETTKEQLGETIHKMESSQKDNTVEKAYVVTAELGDKIMMLFGELPRRLSPMVDPLHKALAESPRADITLSPPEKEEPFKK